MLYPARSGSLLAGHPSATNPFPSLAARFWGTAGAVVSGAKGAPATHSGPFTAVPLMPLLPVFPTADPLPSFIPQPPHNPLRRDLHPLPRRDLRRATRVVPPPRLVQHAVEKPPRHPGGIHGGSERRVLNAVRAGETSRQPTEPQTFLHAVQVEAKRRPIKSGCGMVPGVIDDCGRTDVGVVNARL